MKRESLKKLILVMMYETAWEEKIGKLKLLNAWKGYPFELINELEEEGLIVQGRKSKYVTLTDEGKELAKMIGAGLKDLEENSQLIK
jgi:DNA-binding PadR family transcriptional regulator